MEREIGINNNNSNDQKSGNDDGDKNNDKEIAATPLSPLVEPSMISIPLLPMPYQPGGEPGKGHINYLDSVDAILATEFSPPDRYFTVSALLGRLRDPLKLPYPPNSRMLAAKTLSLPNNKAKKNDAELEKKKKQLALEKQQALLALDKNEVYHMEQPDTTALLNLYKRISSHRTAAVFRKPVNPAEGEKQIILWIMRYLCVLFSFVN